MLTSVIRIVQIDHVTGRELTLESLSKAEDTEVGQGKENGSVGIELFMGAQMNIANQDSL